VLKRKYSSLKGKAEIKRSGKFCNHCCKAASNVAIVIHHVSSNQNRDEIMFVAYLWNFKDPNMVAK